MNEESRTTAPTTVEFCRKCGQDTSAEARCVAAEEALEIAQTCTCVYSMWSSAACQRCGRRGASLPAAVPGEDKRGTIKGIPIQDGR